MTAGTKIFLFFCNGFSDAPTMCQKIKFRNFTKRFYKINSQFSNHFRITRPSTSWGKSGVKSDYICEYMRCRKSRYLHFWFWSQTLTTAFSFKSSFFQSLALRYHVFFCSHVLFCSKIKRLWKKG